MNQFLDNRFAESLQRLALGLEPVDSERRTRIAHPIEITLDGVPPPPPRPEIERHRSCLHALRFQPGVAARVNLRLFDSARRFVPRRLSIPLLTQAQAETRSYTQRVRRPVLFPGAAYDVSDTATGLRGRVLRGGRPMRWARVEATLPVSGVMVGRAHGDDRGDFLLLISSRAGPVGDLVNPFPLEVRVFGPAVAPVPASPDLPALDPLWDLPLETPPAPGAADPVSSGEQLPTNYTASVTRTVNFVLGRLLSQEPVFLI
jgi:hypothetical protein